MTQEEEIKQEQAKMPKLDLSKVANMDALDSADKTAIKKAAEVSKANARRAAKRKFNFTEAIAFPLPSKGRFYSNSSDEELRNGIVKINPMSLADEEIITNKAYLKNGNMFRILFDSCMESEYDSKELLQYDVLFMMYCLRSISYGDDYKFEVTCSDCGKEFAYNMNVSDIDWDEMPDTVVDERDIKLPISKYTVRMRLPRLKDDENETMLKMRHEDDPMYTDAAVTLWSKTLSVRDESGNEIPPTDWIEFFDCLPTLDRNKINESFEESVNQPKTEIICPKCGKHMRFNVPISEDFFRIK